MASSHRMREKDTELVRGTSSSFPVENRIPWSQTDLHIPTKGEEAIVCSPHKMAMSGIFKQHFF